MWIAHIPFAESTGRLRTIYQRIAGSSDRIDNILLAHSLRPHTLEGHMALYKHVLHNTANTVDKWFLEAIGVHVSALNACTYCVDHHFAGLRRLLADDTRADQIRAALADGNHDAAFTAAECAAIDYATTLTQAPPNQASLQAQVIAMRDNGFDDGQILEINQVVAYFCYANRTVLGLGITTDGEPLGLSPNNAENPDDWSHT